MSWINVDNVRRRLLLALSVVSLAVIGLWFGADQNKSSAQLRSKDFKSGKSAPSDSLTFPGTGVGAIPDGACGTNDLQVQFNVSGIPGPPNKVEVRMRFDPPHTYVGDLDLEIVAPNGTRHWLQSYTGGQGGDFGDGSFAIGPYLFSDAAPSAPTWWTAASLALNDDPIPAGSYRTQAPGPFANDSPGPPITNMTAAFSGIPTSNGNWRLVVGDCAGGDVGSIAAADLILNAVPRAVWNDFDGDGKTDHNITRSTNSPSLAGQAAPFIAGSYRERLEQQKENPSVDDLVGSTSIYWYARRSGSGTNSVQNWGIAETDFITPNDFDGDQKADIAIWRAGSAGTAGFYIFQSSTSTFRFEQFGQTNDDSGVTGDYDGDGKADVAVFRCPPTTGQCTFFYRGSAGGGGTTYVPWGNGTLNTIFAAPGDYDGDGKYDFCIQRTHPTLAGKGEFVLLRSMDSGVEFVNWGNNTDLIAPGDYDGDGKHDFTVGRNQGGLRTWYTLFRSGGSRQIQWGLSTDFLTPGDYDGDGKTDLSVWRPSASPGGTYFYTLKSTNFTLEQFPYGIQSDYPPANSQVH